MAVLVTDLIMYRRRLHVTSGDLGKDKKHKSAFLNIYFHNKGIEMINIPSILCSNKVVRAFSPFLPPYMPPMVCFSYTKPISATIFNYKEAVKGLEFNVGTEQMTCNCETSQYICTSWSCGHW